MQLGDEEELKKILESAPDKMVEVALKANELLEKFQEKFGVEGLDVFAKAIVWQSFFKVLVLVEVIKMWEGLYEKRKEVSAIPAEKVEKLEKAGEKLDELIKKAEELEKEEE